MGSGAKNANHRIASGVAKKIVSTVFVLGLLMHQIAFAMPSSSQAVNNTVDYLLAQQNADGSWSDEDRQLVDTLAVYKALLAHVEDEDDDVKPVFDSLSQALIYLRDLPETNSDTVARKVWALLFSSIVAESQVEVLNSLQNLDGGWGLRGLEKPEDNWSDALAKQSNIIDTFLVVDALLNVDPVNSAALTGARNYIVQNITINEESQDDPKPGAWLVSVEPSLSDLGRTAMGLRLLYELQRAGVGDTALRDAMDNAKAYLGNKIAEVTEVDQTTQEPSVVSDFSSWSLVDVALVAHGLMPLAPLFEVQALLDHLYSQQQPDGSWDNNIYTTAAVLQLLNDLGLPDNSDLPDLAVYPETIILKKNGGGPSSDYDLDAADTLDIEVTVSNRGSTTVDGAKVEVFSENPSLNSSAAGIRPEINIGQILPGSSRIATVPVGQLLESDGLFGQTSLYVKVIPTGSATEESNEFNNVAAKAINVTGGKPDLTVENLYVIPASDAIPFQPLQVVAEIKNIGADLNVTAPNEEPFVVQLSDCGDAADCTTSTEVGSLTFAPMASGEKVFATFQTSFASGTTRRIEVDVDPAGQISEGDENNNTQELAFAVTAIDVGTSQKSDVIVTAISLSPSVPNSANASTSVTVDVGNLTDYAVSLKGGSSDFKVKLEKDEGSGYVEISPKKTITSLAAGDEASVSWSGVTLASGSVKLQATVDPDATDVDNELDVDNNTLVIETPVLDHTLTGNELAITSLEVIPLDPGGSQTIGENDWVQLVARVESLETTAITGFEIDFLDGDSVIDTIVHSNLNLTQGQIFDVQLHTRFTFGTKNLSAVIHTITPADVDATNNTATASIFVLKKNDLPDLEVRGVDITFPPSPLTPEQDVPISVLVRNVGDAAVNNVVLRLTDEGVRDDDSDDVVIGDGVLGLIPKGLSTTMTFIVEGGLPPGNRTIRVDVDPDSSIEELNESEESNTARKAVFVSSISGVTGKDLAVESVTFTKGTLVADTDEPEGTVDITITIVHRGDEDITESFDYVIEGDDGSGPTTLHSGTVSGGFLPGQRLGDTITGVDDWALGAWTITGTVDTLVSEANGTNNTKTAQLNVVENLTLPDLVIEEPLTLSGDPVDPDELVQITAIIKNEGTNIATNIKLRLFGDDIILANDGTIPQLASGRSVQFTFEGAFPEFAGQTVNLVVVVDPTNAIAENDDGNNTSAVKTIAINALNGPNLAVESVHGIALKYPVTGNPATSAKPGESIEISFKIKNYGNAASVSSDTATNTFKVLVTDGDPFAGDALLIMDGIQIPDLAVNAESAVQTVTYIVPSVQGYTEIFVLVDSMNEVAESNENDNLSSIRIDVPPVPDLTADADEIALSATLHEGQYDLVDNRTVRVSAVIHNVGDAEANDVRVQFGLENGVAGADVDCGTEADYCLIGEATADSIPAGGTAEVEIFWRPSVSAIYSPLCILIDNDDTIPEFDESNNLICRPDTYDFKDTGDPVSILFCEAQDSPCEENEHDQDFGAFQQVEVTLTGTDRYTDGGIQLAAFAELVIPQIGTQNASVIPLFALGQLNSGDGTELAWTFNTTTLEPGSGYRVNFTLANAGNEELLETFDVTTDATDAGTFTINAEKELQALSVSLNTPQIRFGTHFDLYPLVSVFGAANQDITEVTFTIEMYATDSSGQLTTNPIKTWVVDSASVPISYDLDPGKTFNLLIPQTDYFTDQDLDAVSQSANIISGPAEIRVQAHQDGQDVPNSGPMIVQLDILPANGFNVIKSLHPQSVSPGPREVIDVAIDLLSIGELADPLPMDIVILHDVSTSMEGQKLIESKAAAIEFATDVLNIGGDHTIAVVSYAGPCWRLGLYEPPSPIINTDDGNGEYFSNNLTTITNAINGISIGTAGGCNAHFLGMRAAIDLFTNHPSGRRKIAITLTDGIVDMQTPTNVVLEGELAKSNGIEIYTLGFVTAFDYELATSYDWPSYCILNYYACWGPSGSCCKIDIALLEDLAANSGGFYLAFVGASESPISQVFQDILADIASSGVTKLRVTDIVNSDPEDKISLDLDSIFPEPHSIEFNGNTEAVLSWDIPALKVNETAGFRYQVALEDLVAEETRLVNKQLTIEGFFTDTNKNFKWEIGPQYVTVGDDIGLELTVDDPSKIFMPGDIVPIKIEYEAPGGLYRTEVDFESDAVGGDDKLRTQAGSLVLDWDSNNYYHASGTLHAVIDAGQGSHWGSLEFVGGFPTYRYEQHGNLIRSNLVNDVFYYDHEEAGTWWNDTNASWYLEANDTIVDHALVTGEGWVAVTEHTDALEQALTADFTIEGWINADPLANMETATLFYKGDGKDNTSGTYLHIYVEELAAGAGDKLHIDYEDGGTSLENWDTPIDLDDWRHVAFIIKSDNTAKVYIDNVDTALTTTAPTGFVADGLALLDTLPLVIGGVALFDQGTGDVSYSNNDSDCRIDEITIYDKEQTGPVNWNLKSSHDPPAITSDLVAYWNFDPTAQDLVGLNGGHFVQTDPLIGTGLRRISGRSSENEFPQRTYIVATEESVDIINAVNDSLWMRFLTDRAFLWNISGTTNASSVYVDGAKIYVGQNRTDKGLAVIDFDNDKVYGFDTTRKYVTGTIATPLKLDQRFVRNNTVFEDEDATISLNNGIVNDVIVNGTRLAVATDSKVTLFNNENAVSHSAEAGLVSKIFLTSDDLYYLVQGPKVGNADGPDEVFAVYNNAFPSDGFASSEVYGEGATATPAPISNLMFNLFVTEGTSTAASGDNTLYLATAGGVTVIDEDDASSANTSKRDDLISETDSTQIGVPILSGTSSLATAMHVEGDIIRVGTFAPSPDFTAAVSVIRSSGTSPKFSYELIDELNETGPPPHPPLPRGTVNAICPRLVGTGAGLVVFNEKVDDPVKIRARTIHTSDYMTHFDEVANREPTPGDPAEDYAAASDWTDDILSSGVSLLDMGLSDSRYLQLEFTLTAPGAGSEHDITPVLESVTVGHTPARLAIDVEIQHDGGAISLGQIDITPEMMGATTTFLRHFDTSNATPSDTDASGSLNDYVPVANLIDRETDETLLTASDQFAITEEKSDEALLRRLFTERQDYYIGETIEIQSFLRNISANTPFENVDVTIKILGPKDTSTESEVVFSYNYTLSAFQSGAKDDKRIYKLLTTDLQDSLGNQFFTAQDGYVVRQEVMVNNDGVVLPPLERTFNVKSSADAGLHIDGRLSVDPTYLVQDQDHVVNIDLTYTNTGDAPLNNFDLIVEIVDPSTANDPDPLYTVLPGCTFTTSVTDELAVGKSRSIPRIEKLIDGLAADTYPVYAWADMNTNGDFNDGDNDTDKRFNQSGFDLDFLGSAAPPPPYIAIDLGTLGEASHPRGINNHGDVVGFFDSDMTGTTTNHAFLWKCGKMVDLHADMPGSPAKSEGRGLNDAGHITGIFTNVVGNPPSNEQHGFRWMKSFSGIIDAIDLGTLAGYPVEPWDISNLGVIIGKYNDSGDRALIWDESRNPSLYSPVAGSNAALYGTNDFGDSVGIWINGTTIQGYLQLDGEFVDAATFNNTDSTFLFGINNQQQAVGFSVDISALESQAIVYDRGVYRALSLAALPYQAMAWDINDQEVVVGVFEDEAVIWQDGAQHDLESTLALAPANDLWQFTTAYDINEKGQIAVLGTADGEGRAFRLTPLPFAVTNPNLILWLRADAGVVRDSSDKVTQWVDQTFSGDDLAPGATGTEPQWVSDIDCCSAAVRFDGVDDVLSTQLGTAHTGSSTLFIAMTIDPSTDGTLFASDDDTSQVDGLSVVLDTQADELKLAAQSDYVIGTPSVESVILEIVFDAGSDMVSFYKNGRQVATAAVTDPEQTDYTHFVLGRDRSSGSYAYTAYDVMEVLVFDDALSDDHRKDVENYLTLKHGLLSSSDAQNPQYWYKADADVVTEANDKVSKWGDQSGNDAHAEQSSTSNQPVWEQAGIDCRPAIDFAGLLEPVMDIAVIDMVLVIDRSGSMSPPGNGNPPPGEDRITPARFAAKQFATDLLSDPAAGHRVAVVEFSGDDNDSGDDHTELVVSLTTDLNAVLQGIDSIQTMHELGAPPATGSGTNYVLGLDEMLQEYETNSTGGQNRIALFLSDGEDTHNDDASNSPPPDDDEANIINKAIECRDAGIVVHTIGYSSGINARAERLLEDDIAGTTGGDYFEAPEIEEIDLIFNQAYLEILNKITSDLSSRFLSLVIQTGEDVSARQVIWSEGDVNRGMSIYLDTGLLYFNVWDATAWGTAYLSAPVEAHTPYLIGLGFDGPSGLLTGHLNGNGSPFDTSQATDVGLLNPHNDQITIGGNPIAEATLFHDLSETMNDFYRGQIAEIIDHDDMLSESDRRLVEAYLSRKYNLDYYPASQQPAVADSGADESRTDTDSDGNAEVLLRGLDTTYAAVRGDFEQDSIQNGLVVIEAENYHVNDDTGANDSWDDYTGTSFYSGWSALQSGSDDGDTNATPSEPRLDYRIAFTQAGDHEVWLRGHAPDVSGDTCHVGLNSDTVGALSADFDESEAGWQWVNAGTLNVSVIGTHTLNLWMQEDGFAIDKILLTADTTYTPTDQGPAESLRGDNGLTFEWYDENNILIATGENPTVLLSVGTHRLKLVVTDINGNKTVDTKIFTITQVSSGVLSALYSLDGTADDVTGNYDGQVVGTPSWVAGKSGQAVDLSSGVYIDLNTVSRNVRNYPGGATPRTIMGWFEAGNNPDPTFFGYGDENQSGGGFAITASESRLAVTLNDHTAGVEPIRPLTGLHHLAVIFPDGATRSDQVRIYLDGKAQPIYTLDNSFGPTTVNTNTWSDSAYAYLGRDAEGNTFTGIIDDVRIFSRAMSPEELPVASLDQLQYYLIDLGAVSDITDPHESRGTRINEDGEVVGTSSTFLKENTDYYWRIDEVNSCGVEEGGLWEFETGDQLE